MEQYLNFHTHRAAPDDTETVIRSVSVGRTTGEELAQPFSAGIHPWHVATLPPTAFDELARLAALPGCVAIGEAGLDKLAQAPMAKQCELFERQAQLAAEHKLPIVVHCVKAWDELLALKKSFPDGLPCVVHGFRGKPQQAASLLGHGFHLSFGFRHNAQSLAQCPADRLFLETDEDPRPVGLLYREAALLRGTTPDALRAQCHLNLARLRQAHGSFI